MVSRVVLDERDTHESARYHISVGFLRGIGDILSSGIGESVRNEVFVEFVTEIGNILSSVRRECPRNRPKVDMTCMTDRFGGPSRHVWILEFRIHFLAF